MDSFLTLKVVAVVRETQDAVTIRMVAEPPENVAYRAGQFLTFIFHRGGQEVRRSYSLSSSPEADHELAITVKRIPHGEISSYLFYHIRVGDTLKTLYPAGRFTLPPNPSASRDIFLIAAGSGIAPVYGLLKTILLREPHSKVTLIYSNRNESATIFYHPLNALASQYAARFTCIYIFSDPEDKSYPYRGHLNTFLLEDLVHEHLDFGKDKAEFFLCGPFAFMRMAYMIIGVMGFDKSRIHRENFVILSEQEVIQKPPIGDRSEKTASITYRGSTFDLKMPYDRSILQAALAKGIELPYSCRAGICSTCAAVCKEGTVSMSANEVLTDRDLAQGWVLTCVGYPVTRHVQIEFQ